MDEQTVISKTQRKRDSHALQSLGEELTQLTQEQLLELALPERLLDAVLAAKTITKFGALRRQLQYIGRLMHDVDGKAIAARLEAWKGQSRAATAHLHLLERWRTRLLDDETALGDLAAAYPGCDTQKLRELVHNVQRERGDGKPPRSYRALFQELRRIVPDPLDNAAA
jgi:ribosome-associated protein